MGISARLCQLFDVITTSAPMIAWIPQLFEDGISTLSGANIANHQTHAQGMPAICACANTAG